MFSGTQRQSRVFKMECGVQKDIPVSDSQPPKKDLVNFRSCLEVKGIYKARQLTSHSIGHVK